MALRAFNCHDRPFRIEWKKDINLGEKSQILNAPYANFMVNICRNEQTCPYISSESKILIAPVPLFSTAVFLPKSNNYNN